MPSIAVLVASVVRVMLQPILIGSLAVVMVVARELTPGWPTRGFRWKLYDAVMAGLIFLLFVYVLLRIQTL
ncbi:MAG: hypothetical protein ACREDE_07100 [Thermoplasmata archaeon]